ncbi:MAG TPA: flagellar basal body P-ring formation chaperone FlgA [Terriglobia bacterium]|nr:flagellar basal body P-ring formation chaperone FlgA [Terriglobia bacterium]
MMRFRLMAMIAAISLSVSFTAVGQPQRASASDKSGPASSGPAGGKAAPGERVAILSHVTLHSATLTLADLLPGSAPSELREQAAAASLGAAPQPPMARVIYRQQLQFLLQDDKSLLAQIRIPTEIRVERFHQMITKQEIVSAIEQALGGKSASEDALNLDALEWAAPVYAATSDPGLRVIRIESDPARHETRFRLWTAKEPANLPFSVTVPGAAKLPVLVATRGLAPGEVVSATDFAIEMRPAVEMPAKPLATAAGLEGLESRVTLRSGQPVIRDDFGRPVLVKPETLATLIVEGNGFRIKTMVTPLQQGVLNQEIRVRNNESRQVVEARVVGQDSLLKTR